MAYIEIIIATILIITLTTLIVREYGSWGASRNTSIKKRFTSRVIFIVLFMLGGTILLVINELIPFEGSAPQGFEISKADYFILVLSFITFNVSVVTRSNH